MGNFSNLLSEAFAHSSIATTPSLMTLRPETEPTMEISADIRTIAVPKELRNLAVKKDRNSETVYFNCPRYFDGKDLSEHKCIICYNNAKKQYDESDAVDMIVNDDTLHFGWSIDEKVTVEAGTISFQVVFETVDEYRWGTQPATANILNGLDVTEGNESDTTFWQTMTVQVDALRDEVAELQNDIEEYNDVITELQNSISDLDTPSLDVTDESVVIKSTYSGDTPKASSITIDGNDGIDIETTGVINIATEDEISISSETTTISIEGGCAVNIHGEESVELHAATSGITLYNNYGSGSRIDLDYSSDGGVEIATPYKITMHSDESTTIDSPSYVKIKGDKDISIISKASAKFESEGSDLCVSANGCLDLYGDNYGVNIYGTKMSDGMVDASGTIKLGNGHGVDITSPNQVVVNGVQGINLGSKGNVIINGSTSLNMETVGDLTLKGQSTEVASNTTVDINGTIGVNINTNSFLTLKGNSTQLISPNVNIGVQNEDISYTGDINIVAADDGVLIHGGNGAVSIRGVDDSGNNIFGRVDLDYGVNTTGSRFYAQANEDIWLEGFGGNISINSDKTIDIDSNGAVNIEAGGTKTINLNSKIKYGTPVAINDTYSAIPIVNSDGVERYMLLGTTLDALTNLVNLLTTASE